jgi:uncharacterized protein YjiS (DUF1127 family)
MANTHSLHSSSANASRGFAGLTRLPRTLITMISVARQRQALAQLDQAQLNDIGVTYKAAHNESTRGFWDVPNHWTK